jgi:galactokinase
MVTPFSDPTVDADALRARFIQRFGAAPRLFRAPGRINIIGEHTDYSEGLALPAAIDRACTIAAAPNTQGLLRLVSLNFQDDIERPVDAFERRDHWSDYVAGCAAALQAEGGRRQGWDLVIASEVPLGAGVSSSAALTVATSLSMIAETSNPVDRERVRAIAWSAENRFAGMPCGPLDQFASVFGRRDHALLMDCRALTADAIPLPADTAFVLIDSGAKHKLVDGGYEQRRRECEQAAAQLGVKVLRDASLPDLEQLEAPLRQRARHVITENARVIQTAAALRTGDYARAGALMAQSHQSLSEDFAVTCAETNSLAETANTTTGVYGARQMGGGFGGCVIALVDAPRARDAAKRIAETYRQRWTIGGDWFICRAADGAGELHI